MEIRWRTLNEYRRELARKFPELSSKSIGDEIEQQAISGELLLCWRDIRTKQLGGGIDPSWLLDPFNRCVLRSGDGNDVFAYYQELLVAPLREEPEPPPKAIGP